MKSRRDFLAALGLGAGASVLGLPEMARACGWGRRRARGCCSTCGGVYGECACVHAYDTSCDCCCPLYLYATGNNIWYYYCQCCPTGNCFAPSSKDYGDPKTYPTCYPPASKAQCIGAACGGFYPGGKRLDSRPLVYGNFFLDPNAKYDGNWHADAFIKGAKKVNKPEDLKIKTYKGSIDKRTTVRLGGGYAILLDISGPGDTLYIGFEVLYKPDGAIVTPDNYTSPNLQDFNYYCQVVMSGNTYHVVSPDKY